MFSHEEKAIVLVSESWHETDYLY